MFQTIPASDVRPGMQLCLEYAPGREAEPIIWEVIDNEDGTFGFTVATFGLMNGYRADEMVAVIV